MSKKFSTLMAGLLLAGGVTTANAQVAATSDAIASITEGAVYVLAVNNTGAAPAMTSSAAGNAVKSYRQFCIHSLV